MAKIKEEDIDALRDRADIVDIVSNYTTLKKSGGQSFKGLCPFHSEKTPSFQVNAATGLFHCLAGETGVITWTGTYPIEKLAGDTHRLLTTGTAGRGNWVDAEIKSFGEQRLWEIKLSRNRCKKSIFATDGHRWFVRAGKSGRSLREKTTSVLKSGDRLPSLFANARAGLPCAPSAFGIAQGFTFGDGHKIGRYGTAASFYGEKDLELLQYFPAASKEWVNPSGRRIGGLPSFFKDLPPLDEAPGYLYGWLAGYFAADGCVSKDGQVILSCANREVLEFVRTLCNRLGIGTYGVKHQSRFGLGKEKSDLFHLTFINSTIRSEFFVLSKHRERFENFGQGRTERPGWVVESVEPTDRVEEVFCAVVPGTHAFVLEDNILTGNCFGCQEGGNVYQFVQKVESLPFPEAVEWVARRSGYELRYEEMRPGEQKRAGLKARIIEANKIAADFFHKTLMESPDALQARQYLEGRGFDREIAERWQLGYAPGRDALCKLLQQKGFSREEITQADLGRVSDRDSSLYDSFRQRIIFPTWSLQGDVVAFGARALGDQQPKYLNTSETPVFSKGRMMFGLDRAKSSIARSQAVVVEGYTDVIALHEAGVTQAVATNGTALGESHFELLKKFTNRTVLMFDADEAGKGAAERGWGVSADLKQAPLAARIGIEVLVAPLPIGRDPADIAIENGREGIDKVLENAQPLIEFKLEQTITKLPLDTPEARARAVREAVRVLGWHPDPIARHQYTFSVARRIGIEAEAVQRALTEERSFAPNEGERGRSEPSRRVPGHVKVEKEALKLLLTGNQEAVGLIDTVDESNFTAPPRRELFARVRDAVKQGRPIDAGIAEDLSADASALFSEIAVGQEPYMHDDATAAAGLDEAREIFSRLKLFSLERNIKTRRMKLQDLNPLDDAERHDALFTELVGLEAERRDLLRSIQGAA